MKFTPFLVDLPIQNGQIFHSYLNHYQGKSYKIPLNHNFPMVFLWFTYSTQVVWEFPMLCIYRRVRLGEPRSAWDAMAPGAQVGPVRTVALPIEAECGTLQPKGWV